MLNIQICNVTIHMSTHQLGTQLCQFIRELIIGHALRDLKERTNHKYCAEKIRRMWRSPLMKKSALDFAFDRFSFVPGRCPA